MPFEYLFPIGVASFFFVAGFWMMAHLLPFKDHPTLRKHLMQGPTAFLATIAVLWVGQQFVLVQQGKNEITEYVHHGGCPTELPNLRLHLVLWSRRCGNANEGLAYAIYGMTAARGIDDPDPNVRARSLHLTLSLYDYPEGRPEVRDLIERARKESDPVFRVILKKYDVAD